VDWINHGSVLDLILDNISKQCMELATKEIIKLASPTLNDLINELKNNPDESNI